MINISLRFRWLTIFSCFIVLATLTSPVQAQDSRQVKEPVNPPVCTLVAATLTVQQTEAQDGAAPDTRRLQQAIAACPAGSAVRLVRAGENSAFLSGALSMKPGVSLLIDFGVTLFASRDPADFDRGAASCGQTDEKGRGCRPFILMEKSRMAGIYGEGMIDGQGGAKMLGRSESWWELARRAQREDKHQNVPRLIEIIQSEDISAYQIWLKNAANFHLTLNAVNGFTAWGVHIDTPSHARNTDGIDPVSSKNITITKSFIRTGDDNIAIKAGQQGATEFVSIIDNHFYHGHGMSIGSETHGGVRHVLVSQLTIDGATSGLRIKSDISRGGLVQDVHYRQVCIQNSKTPLDFDSFYGKRAQGELIPQFQDIQLQQVQVLTPGKLVFRGYDAAHVMRLQTSELQLAAGSVVQAQHAQLSAGARSDLTPDFRLQPAAESAATNTCASQFQPYPVYGQQQRRPQLTAAQVPHYAYEQVLGFAGLPGQERPDPWDPLAAPIPAAGQFRPDYVVSLTQPADGKTHFHSVQAAINRMLMDMAMHAQTQTQTGKPGKERIYILLQPGIYEELVYLPATPVPVSLIGSGSADTRIRANLDAAISGATYLQRFGQQFLDAPPAVREMSDSIAQKALIGTFGSPVLWVKSQGFQMRDITLENSYNKSGQAQPAACEGSACAGDGVYAKMNLVHHQALALMTDGVDKAQFDSVRLLGLQDTVYLRNQADGSTARNFFYRSYIEGDVDFIFGDATAYFLQTEIRSLGPRSSSYVAAPSTNLFSRYGFVFNQCRFTHDGSAYALSGKFYLVRQWFHNQKCTPYAEVPVTNYQCQAGDSNQFTSPSGTITRATLETVGKMIVLNSEIGTHIQAKNPWSDWNRRGTLPYRPAQMDSQDYWRNLLTSKIHPLRDLGYREPPAAGQFLGEWNNRLGIDHASSVAQ